MNFNKRKTLVFLFKRHEQVCLEISGKLHSAPNVVLLDKALKAENFDLFEKGENPKWLEDARNFTWFSKELNSTPYLFASRAHRADIIIRVDREETASGFGKGFIFTKVDKRKTERETLDALLLDGLLRCEEIMMAVGRFEGGIINSKYCAKQGRSA